MRSILLLALLCSYAAGPGKPVSVLIVDGMNNHDWQTATREIKEMLLASKQFTVDVSTARIDDWDAWKPEFSRYQVVINNFNGGHTGKGVRWPARVEKALEEYLRGGGGLVVYHAANNAFLEWQAYNEMIGLGWRAKAFGPGLAVG